MRGFCWNDFDYFVAAAAGAGATSTGVVSGAGVASAAFCSSAATIIFTILSGFAGGSPRLIWSTNCMPSTT